MRWLVTLDLPHEDQPHAHIDVATPAQAAKVVRAVREATRLPIAFTISSYDTEWRCAECPAWRFDLGSNLVTQFDDRPMSVWAADLLPLDQ